MYLIVQIPCYNEQETLRRTINEIPRDIPGVDRVDILVIDDGSSDTTSAVARDAGADHIVRHRRNRGLAEAFRTGIDSCLRRGADIIVNTDADNQYVGADIPALVAPLLSQTADVVIGDRGTATLSHFSRTKRLLQAIGSAVVRRCSGTSVPDAVSGFRAFSREAAMQLSGVCGFSYTIESLIQLGTRRLAVETVRIRTNPVTRPSRLFRSVPAFLVQSAAIVLRSSAMHRPLYVFGALSAAVTSVGLVPIIRFLYFYLVDGGRGHVQSLILGSALLSIGFMVLVLGLLADLIACNRRLIETTLEKVRRIEAARTSPVVAQYPAPLAETNGHGTVQISGDKP